MLLTVEQFGQRLMSSGVMSADELRDWTTAVPVEQRGTDGETLAKALVKDKRLTEYQAEQFLAGQGDSLTLGNYVILDLLGQGGMGTVFKAEHRRMKRLVALKVISTSKMNSLDAVQRFHREVEVVAKLSHPNIVAAYDADEDKGTHFLVMELVNGEDLSRLVKVHGPLPAEQAVECIVQAAHGLAHAHRHGVIHRDIKPANLLMEQVSGEPGGVSPRTSSHVRGLTPAGSPMDVVNIKILDMGLARLNAAATGARATELTHSGDVMGTVDYMSPEQALNTKNADARSDIYSLGCTLYYLLTGHAAYGGESVMEKLVAHREQPIPELVLGVRGQGSGVSEDARLSASALDSRLSSLNSIFQRMVAKNPAERYPSMLDVIADLQRWQGGATRLSSETISNVGDALSHDEPLVARSPSSRTSGPIAAAVASPSAASKTATELDKTVTFRGHSSDTDPSTHLSLGSSASRANEAAETEVLRSRLRTWKWITSTVVVCLLLAGVIWSVIANRPRDVSNSEQQPAGGSNGPKQRDVAKNAGKPATDDLADRPGDAIDLLVQVELPRDAWVGEWTRQAQTLISPAGLNYGRIMIREPPPPEYELVAVVERVTGVDGVLLGVILEGHSASVVIDCFQSQISAISMIDGQWGDANESTVRQRFLQDNHPHTIRVSVGRRSIKLRVDGRPVIHWQGDPARLSSPSEQIPDPSKLWFGSAYHQFKFHKLELWPLRPRWPFDPDDGQGYEWSRPEHLGAEINSADIETLWGISGDERSIFFSRMKMQTAEAPVIFSSHRADPRGPFPKPTPVSLSGLHFNGAMSTDGLIAVGTKRGPEDTAELYWSIRPTTDGPFPAPDLMTAPVNAGALNRHPIFSADALTLLTTSRRAGSAWADVWMFTRESLDQPFTTAERLPEPLNTTDWDIPHFVSNDRTTILVSHQRTAQQRAVRTFHLCTRASADQPFDTDIPVRLPLGDVTDTDLSGRYCLSADGRSLYFHAALRTDGLGGQDLYVCRRVPRANATTAKAADEKPPP